MMSNLSFLTLLVIGTLSAGLALGEPEAIPAYSVAKLDVGQATSDATPDLSWEITHPGTQSDVVQVNPDTGSIVTRTDVRLRVNVIGIGQQMTDSRRRAALWLSTGGLGNWQMLFDGTPKTVRSWETVLDQTFPANTSIDLAARAFSTINGSWLAVRSTTNPDGYVKCLANGDAIPYAIEKSPQDFLHAYFSAPSTGSETDQRTISAGPKDLLYGFELDASSPSTHNFNLQDIVVMLSFEGV